PRRGTHRRRSEARGGGTPHRSDGVIWAKGQRGRGSSCRFDRCAHRLIDASISRLLTRDPPVVGERCLGANDALDLLELGEGCRRDLLERWALEREEDVTSAVHDRRTVEPVAELVSEAPEYLARTSLLHPDADERDDVADVPLQPDQLLGGPHIDRPLVGELVGHAIPEGRR